MTKLLSIIVITKNNLEGLKRTVESIFKQRNDKSIEFEVIIIDSLSNDGSKEFVNSINNKIHYIYEKDNGIYDALNKGIHLSNGDFLWFLNAGDYIVGEIFSSLILVQSYLPRGYIDRFGTLSFRTYPLWYGMPTSHQAIIYEKSDNLYSLKYKYNADYIYTIVASKRKKFIKQKTEGYVYYDTTGISSTNYLEMISKKNEINKIFYPAYLPLTYAIDSIKKLFYKIKHINVK